MTWARIGALAALMMSGSAAWAVCGDDTGACEMESGTYHIKLPIEARADMPVVIFLHGYGSSGQNAISLNRMVDPLRARGYAVIAPDGKPRAEDGTGPNSWVFYPGWPGRDEAAFLKDVVADSADRFGTSMETVLLSGFSAGGFMVNYLACEAPDSFSAYAPVSGGFWRPHPAECDGPVKLFHTHGWTDGTVPLEGRKLAGGRWQQGDIFAGLEIWRAANECSDEKPSGYQT
ncbi:MAG: alpha/beta fold hydrolase, partial [Pseudomonadota bacterium]